jgi:Immunoglobulin domain
MSHITRLHTICAFLCATTELFAQFTYTNNNTRTTIVPYMGTYTYSVTWTGGNDAPLQCGYVKSVYVRQLHTPPNPDTIITINSCYGTNDTYSYTFTGISASNDGYYYLYLDAGYYGSTSYNNYSTTPVYVHVAPAILVQPSDTFCLQGCSTSMGISAGPSTATFTWIDAATASVLGTGTSFSPNVTNNGERVYCRISNSYGTVTSSSAVLTVGAAPSITSEPTNVLATVGSPATFAVSASASPTLRYQWYKHGIGIQGANLNYIAFSAVTNTDAGTYQVVITNTYGQTNSSAVLSVGTKVAITNQPISLTVTQGQTASFSVGASGSTPISYQWTKDTGTIANATNSTLAVTNTLASSAGTYSVIVTNLYGGVTSSNAVLAVVGMPPQSLQIYALSSNAVALQMNGSVGFRYVLETTTNLAPPVSWQAMVTNEADSNGLWSCCDTNVTHTRALYYRGAMP